MTENLPAIIPPADLTPESTEKEILQSDLIIANNVLKHLHLAWNSVSTITGIQKLAATTFGAIRERRLMLGRPYVTTVAKTTWDGVAKTLD